MTAATEARRDRTGWPVGQIALGAAPWVAAAAVPWVMLLVVRDRLPAEVISHTGTDGPDGFMAPANFVAVICLFFLLQGAVFVWALIKRAQTEGHYLLTAAACWALGTGEAYFFAADLHANALGRALDRKQLATAYDFDWALHLPVTAVLAAVAAGLGVLMARKAVRR